MTTWALLAPGPSASAELAERLRGFPLGVVGNAFELAPWADFIFVNMIMGPTAYKNYTVALGLFRMIDREHITTYFSMFCAGAVLVSIPIVALFISLQKFYVEGITGGSVKG